MPVNLIEAVEKQGCGCGDKCEDKSGKECTCHPKHATIQNLGWYA